MYFFKRENYLICAALVILVLVAPANTQLDYMETFNPRTLGAEPIVPIVPNKPSSTVTCSQFLISIMNAFNPTNPSKSTIPASLMNVVLNSGKGINDLGFYDSCVHDPTTNYYTMRPEKKIYEKKIFFGFCLPNECDLGTINEFLTPYFSAQIVPALEKINQATGQFTLVAVDPNSHEEMSFAGMFTIVLFSAIGIVSCVGCCFNQSVMKRDQTWVESMRDNLGQRYDEVLHENEIAETERLERRESAFIKFSQCFDFLENMKRLFKDNQKSYFQLTYLDGLRSFALIYTIFANDYWARYSTSQNISDNYSIETFKNSWTYLFCVGGQYGIDIFLFASGLSSFITYYERLKESRVRGFMGYVLFYVKALFSKWMTIAPIYFILAAFYYTVMPTTVDGPVNSIIHDYSLQCGDGGFWYSFILFGNLNINYQCMSWCWYLGVEFQAFIFALVSIILYKNIKMAGYMSLVFWILASVGISIGIWQGKDLTLPVSVIPRESIHDDYMMFFYAQSFTRWSAYMVGGLVACVVLSKVEKEMPAEFSNNPIGLADLDKEEIFESNGSSQPDARVPSFIAVETNTTEKPQRKTSYDWMLAIPCTIAGILLMILPILIYRFYQNDFNNGKTWGSASQMFFAIMGSWSVIAGVIVMGLPVFFGKTSVALMFFGGSFWSPLSRMFIGMYIIHMLLIQYNIAQSYAFQYLDNFVIQNYMFADLFFSFLLAIVFVSLVEMPFSRFAKKLCWN